MALTSPLFQRATREIRREAESAFRRTDMGKLVSEVQNLKRVGQAARGGGDQFQRAMMRYSGGGAESVLRELRGMQFGRFATELMRYSSGGLGGLITQFLGDLGPAGKLIQAIAGVGAGGRVGGLEYLAELLRSQGWEALPPPGALRRGAFGKRALEAAQQYLDEAANEVLGPGERADRNLKDAQRKAREAQPHTAAPPSEPTEVAIPLRRGGAGHFPPDHPIVTGAMVPAPGSSNVHSFGYDYHSDYLYVRFLDGYNRQTKHKEGPGPLYRYSGVTPEEFLELLTIGSKGGWVWDHLRIRGTVSGHQKSWELVGIQEKPFGRTYVPRQATVFWNEKTGQLQELFLKREIRGTSGRWFESNLATEAVDRAKLPAYMLGLDRGARPFDPFGGGGGGSSTSPDSARPDRTG